MPRKPKKDRAQLEVMRIQGNQRAIRAETIRRERVLAPMVRVVSRRPELQQRFARDGGLVNFMLREEASQERDNFAPEIFSQQTNLYNNRFFGENIDTLTPLTELEEEFEKVKQKVSTIQKELQDCCEEIKNKLDQVSQQTKAQGEQTRRRINRKTVQILRKLQQLYDRLKALLQEKFQGLEETLQNIQRILEQDIPARFYAIDSQCTEIFNYLSLTLKPILDFVLQEIEIKSEALRVQIEVFQASLKATLDAKFLTIETSIGGIAAAVELVQGSIVGIEASLITIEGAIAGAIVAINEAVAAEHYLTRGRVNTVGNEIKSLVKKEVETLSSEIKQLQKEFKQELEKVKKELLERFEKEKKEILKAIQEESKKFIEKTALEVSQLIVGESYYKWDSTSSYFPTVIFVFNEMVEAETPRRSQIKARLKKTSQELTDDDIEQLKKRVQQYKEWKYSYGSVRANYVSSDKRWKSTVFASQQSEARSVFQTVGKILDEEIDFKLISFTSLEKKRPRITTRTTPLAGKGLNLSNYDSVFTLQLRKATLLVNNTERPYLLYP